MKVNSEFVSILRSKIVYSGKKKFITQFHITSTGWLFGSPAGYASRAKFTKIMKMAE